MLWAFVFVVQAWMAHLVIPTGSLVKTVNLLGFIALGAGGLWLFRRVLTTRRRIARHDH